MRKVQPRISAGHFSIVMKVIYTRIAGGVKHIQVELYYVICIDIFLNKIVSKNYIQKYPVDFCIYPPFDLKTTLASGKIEPLQYGTFYIPVSHNYTNRELINHIIKKNDLYKTFPALY